jgi:hypothetical protein
VLVCLAACAPAPVLPAKPEIERTVPNAMTCARLHVEMRNVDVSAKTVVSGGWTGSCDTGPSSWLRNVSDDRTVIEGTSASAVSMELSRGARQRTRDGRTDRPGDDARKGVGIGKCRERREIDDCVDAVRGRDGRVETIVTANGTESLETSR